MKKAFLILVIITFKSYSQNPDFYQSHPTLENVQWYTQINKDPVIFINGEMESENEK